MPRADDVGLRVHAGRVVGVDLLVDLHRAELGGHRAAHRRREDVAEHRGAEHARGGVAGHGPRKSDAPIDRRKK